MKLMSAAIALSAALLLTAAGAFAQDAKAEQGMKVFVAQKCTTCHAIAGKGNKKGALDDVGRRLSAADIRAWIVDPEAMQAKTPPKRKPPMKKKALPPGDVDALVALLASLKGS